MHLGLAAPGIGQNAVRVSGTVVDVDLAAGRFFVEDGGTISTFRDHPMAMHDLHVKQPVTFQAMDSQNGETWRWHPMFALASVPERWETGIVSGQLKKIDWTESMLWLDAERIHGHPAQLAELEEGSVVRLNYAEHDGQKWLLSLAPKAAGRGRPAGLFSQDSIPAGPGTGSRSNASAPFSRNSLPAPITMPKEAAESTGPLGVGVWGPPDEVPDEMSE